MLIRGSMFVSYNVTLGETNTLFYSNLDLKYNEEIIAPDKLGRGYKVHQKEEVGRYSIPQQFAKLTVFTLPPTSKMVHLRIELDACILLDQYGIATCPAIPYGHLPIHKKDAGEIRSNDALLSYLKTRVLNDFDVDLFRATIGHFLTSEDVREGQPKFLSIIRKKWSLSPFCSESNTEKIPTVLERGIDHAPSTIIAEGIRLVS